MSDELVKRLSETAEAQMRAEPLDTPGHYLNVIAKVSRADGTLMQEAAARIAALEAQVREMGTPDGAAARLLDYCRDPDAGDDASEVWRLMNWNALYNAMREDDGDLPAMICTWLEAISGGSKTLSTLTGEKP